MSQSAKSTVRETAAARFTRIERRQHEAPGVKEMTLTRKPREEDAAKRAERFIRMEREAAS